MLYVDPNTGASFFITLDGQVSSFVQTPQYYTPQNLDPQQCSLPLLAQHSTSTLGVQQAYSAVNNQGYKSTVAAQSQVDDLIDLVDILSQQEDPATESQDQVAELAFSLKNSLPSTPTSSEALDSPPMMHRMESLPGISTLSAEISSLQAQLLGPLPPTPVKKQYPFYPSPAPSRVSAPQPSSILPSLPHLPTLNRPNPAQQQQRKHARFQELSPESSPCSSPPPSPKRNKKNYTKEFNLRFHELLNSNEQASNEWHLYAGQHKGKCTIKRAPCIKVSRGFCASYGHEFTDLAKEEKYGALGTRTECACMHKPQPLSSSGPSRKQRQSIRSAPYPSYSSPSTPQELELPSTPAEPSSKNAWISFLLQNAAMLHEGFNSFMGGLQCSTCTARRAFASRDEVIAYLMQEPIACTQECCAGAMQLHQ